MRLKAELSLRIFIQIARCVHLRWRSLVQSARTDRSSSIIMTSSFLYIENFGRRYRLPIVIIPRIFFFFVIRLYMYYYIYIIRKGGEGAVDRAVKAFDYNPRDPDRVSMGTLD